ncbi:MAG: class I SAM-dependent methyltransferase [Anaerolineae bacterium]
MVTQDEKVREQYRDNHNLNARIALHARFSTNPYGWQRWLFDRMVEKLPSRARLLELGCGPADLWTANRDRIPCGWRATLTDFSSGMVRTARENLGDVKHPFTFSLADAQALPVADPTFDAIIANHMLYHVPDREGALREIVRALPQGQEKQGGWLFASTVGERHMYEMWELMTPYLADVHERTQSVSQGFTLENGGAQLSRYFSAVERYDYDDHLRVTEAEPIIAYLRSSTTLMNCDLDESMVAELREHISGEIEAHGAFHIRKASGLFVAHGP